MPKRIFENHWVAIGNRHGFQKSAIESTQEQALKIADEWKSFGYDVQVLTVAQFVRRNPA